MWRMKMDLKKGNKNDWNARVYILGWKVKSSVLFGLEKG